MTENIVITNAKELEKTKSKIAKDGFKKLHILTDFDKTLTKTFVNDEKIPSIISVLRDGNYLTKDYAEKAHALYNKYHPIEINPEIPLKEKKEAMYDWWKNHFDLLIKSRLNKKDIEKVVNSGKVEFRDGALDLIKFLHKHNIPLIIMSSSGLGYESISMYLEKHKCFYNNIHIISNAFIWDKDDYAIGIKEPIIYVMNKDETILQDFPVFKIIKNRKNVILLGDNIEDIGMVEGFNYNNLIKIGFLNDDVNKNLPYYKQNYDILILNDSGMGYVNGLLRELIEG